MSTLDASTQSPGPYFWINVNLDDAECNVQGNVLVFPGKTFSHDLKNSWAGFYTDRFEWIGKIIGVDGSALIMERDVNLKRGTHKASLRVDAIITYFNQTLQNSLAYRHAWPETAAIGDAKLVNTGSAWPTDEKGS